MGDTLQILGFALLSMANPTLLAAVTVMLLMPSPPRLMLGYLLGAYLTSIASGLLIVFSLEGTGFADAGKSTVGPGQDLLIGLLLLVVAVVLRSGAASRWRERRSARRREREGDGGRDSLPIRLLGRGSARVAFAVGVLLSFPGASYLLGLTHIDQLGAGAPVTALLVVGFCLIQMLLLELPLLGYAIAPERTTAAVASFRAWLRRNGRRAAANVAAVLGLLLVLRAIVVLLT